MSRLNDNRNSSGSTAGLRVLLCLIAMTALAAVAVTSRGGDDPDNPDRVAPSIPGADRYASGRIFLEQADKLLKPSADVEYQVLTGNVIFRRGDMYMYCDSAHFYDATSSLQAFGNVKMEQGDTLFVYADELEYTDSTELAVLYADEGKKVRLINRDVELKTDIFNYDMGIELGYYEVGGELTDLKNRLTSVYGEYAPNTKDANFRNRVHLCSRGDNDTLNIYTEALHYNTDTHIADLTEVSTITSKDGTIYTDNGVYNTETSVADLYSRSLVVTSTGKTLTGDTLFYDRNAGYGRAWGNMILNDTVNKSKLLGDYGFYNELTDSAFVTGHAKAVDYSSADSLSLHGDTIQAFRIIKCSLVPMQQPAPPAPVLPADSMGAMPDTLAALADPLFAELTPADTVPADPLPADTLFAEIQPADSIPAEPMPADTLFAEIQPADSVPADMLSDLLPDSAAMIAVPLDIPDEMTELCDTTHHIVAYPNVRFFRTDLQGVCDSMTFVQKDSLLHMDIDPIVWSGERQIFGDQIIVHMNDSTADRVDLPSNAFMAEKLEDGYYNQMSGRTMVAHLAEGTLRHLDLSGNVTIVFYPMEEDSTYNKVANAESSFLAADFEKGQIKLMKMWPQSTEVMTPLYMAKRSLFFLPNFRWEADRRPKDHDDIMPRPSVAADSVTAAATDSVISTATEPTNEITEPAPESVGTGEQPGVPTEPDSSPTTVQATENRNDHDNPTAD